MVFAADAATATDDDADATDDDETADGGATKAAVSNYTETDLNSLFDLRSLRQSFPAF